jgi:hypothetical protein
MVLHFPSQNKLVCFLLLHADEMAAVLGRLPARNVHMASTREAPGKQGAVILKRPKARNGINEILLTTLARNAKVFVQSFKKAQHRFTSVVKSPRNCPSMLSVP